MIYTKWVVVAQNSLVGSYYPAAVFDTEEAAAEDIRRRMNTPGEDECIGIMPYEVPAEEIVASPGLAKSLQQEG